LFAVVIQCCYIEQEEAMKKRKKKDVTVQARKALARELVPVSSIRVKVVPSKKWKMLDKLAKREAREV
jgi:hypothetical protein